MEAQEVDVEDLELLVIVVSALGQLVATVTAPRRDEWPLLYPESLHRDLWKFTWSLRDTLGQRGVTSLRQRGVTSLSQALVTLGATPGHVQDDVRATVRAWREAWDKVDKSWTRLFEEAVKIFDTFKGEATNEATKEATKEAIATCLARDLRDETLPGRGTAGDSLVAAASQLSVSLSSMVAAASQPSMSLSSMVAAASQPSMSLSSMVATASQPSMSLSSMVATRRGQRLGEARELLRRLVKACDEAFNWVSADLRDWLGSVEEGMFEVTPEDLEDLLEQAAVLERLWETGTRLARRHLLGTIGDIQRFLWSPCGGSGGPLGPRGRAVAERCRKAVEDVPRLLGRR